MNEEKVIEIIRECENVVETHKNHFKVMVDFLKINEVVTLQQIFDIRIIEDIVWFNDINNIHLEDLNKLELWEVRSYL